MSDDDDNFYKDGYWDWHKEGKGKKIWWTSPVDSFGGTVFSFDKKTAFNFWTDYPDKLTDEQIKIFKEANPTLAALK